jgi:metalloprotease
MFPGGTEALLLLAVIALLFLVPRLQKKLEQRVNEGKIGAEALRQLQARVTVTPLDEGLPVAILAGFAEARTLRISSYRVHRSDEQGVNAIALPGGDVVLTAGLLALAESGRIDEHELAAVLAHEVAHIELGHSRQAEVRETMTRWATMALPPGMGAAVKMGARVAVQALKKRSSREAELEADAWALGLLKQAGRDPEAMARFLKKTAAWSGGGGLWSTHPAAADRIEALRANGGS